MPRVSFALGPTLLQPGTKEVVDNPTIVVVVLSPRTEQYDRGVKWEGYRRIASLTDYLLVSQKTAMIEHLRRETDGSWRHRAAGTAEQLSLTGGAMLDVDTIYENVLELAGDDSSLAGGDRRHFFR